MIKRSVWFGVALLVQIGILAALPLRRGDSAKEIWLPAKARNLDHVMRGAGIRIEYEFARTEAHRKRGETVYVTLRMQTDSTWTVEGTGPEKPSMVSAGEVVIRGKTAYRWVPIHVLLRKAASGEWIADSVVTGQEDDPPGYGETDQAVARTSIREKYVNFGIGYYNVPERLRKSIVEDIREHPDEFTALVQVSPDGRASLLGFRVQDREFRF